jgi:type II secretory pathway component PulF
LLPLYGILYAFHYVLTLPMRRNERTRVFLDLLELGLKDGRTPEAAVMEAAASRDRSIGVRFHLLAAHIQNGLRFNQALEKVPRLLSPQIRAMLKAGERIGNMAKVLPACRQLLRDGVSQVRGALNYLVLLVFCVTPFTVFVPIVLNLRVLPKYREIFGGMGVGRLPAFSEFIFSKNNIFILLQIALLIAIWVIALVYIGGPALRRWLQSFLPAGTDGVSWLLPWRRKRLHRDFSAILAVLLDSGVPEAEAVTLAAESTANTIVIRRAAKVRALLNTGVTLPESLREFDDTGELHWRISNALRGRGGFLRALAGWHEALDAKAFQLEQTAAQVITTAFVLFNGLFVACVVIAVFLMLISLLNEAILW